MKHLGDITKMKGFTTPAVDVITGGSPCQDLSVAGKRAGLAGARSGLFMEQIRLIKEMRGATFNVYPKYMVWENVPGAFSSNGGKDFQAVLEECAHVVDETAVIPEPPKGKWPTAGCIMGDGYSIAWCTMDAQYWGVPQRRRRIALVVDFGGKSAPEILFEREGVSRDSEPCGEARKGITSDSETGAGVSSGSLRGDCESFGGQQNASEEVRVNPETAYTLNTNSNATGRNSPLVAQPICYPEIARSLTARNDGSPCIDRGPDVVCYPLNTMLVTRDKALGRGTGLGVGENGEAQFTLSAAHCHAVCYAIDSLSSNSMKSKNPHSGFHEEQQVKTLDASGVDPTCNQGGNVIVQPYALRMRSGKEGGGKGPLVQTDLSGTLGTGNDQTIFACYPINDKATRYQGGGESRNGDGRGNGLGVGADGDPSPTITAADRHIVCAIASTCANAEMTDGGISPTLTARAGTGGNQLPCVVTKTYAMQAIGEYKDATDLVTYSVDCRNNAEHEEIHGTLQAKENGGQSLNYMGAIRENHTIYPLYIVRRLTPLECERLQGYPDGWTDIGEWTDSKGKKHKDADSPRYKALGNSIALPQWYYVLGGIAKRVPENATLGSLFDGIGGFPKVWSDLHNGNKSLCVWASEIEEFPIAVTKVRFPE